LKDKGNEALVEDKAGPEQGSGDMTKGEEEAEDGGIRRDEDVSDDKEDGMPAK